MQGPSEESLDEEGVGVELVDLVADPPGIIHVELPGVQDRASPRRGEEHPCDDHAQGQGEPVGTEVCEGGPGIRGFVRPVTGGNDGVCSHLATSRSMSEAGRIPATGSSVIVWRTRVPAGSDNVSKCTATEVGAGTHGRTGTFVHTPMGILLS